MSARRRGFTLMEVVIAIAITSFIGVVIGVTFNTTIQNKEIIEGQAEHYRMLRTAMNRMVREIGARLRERSLRLQALPRRLRSPHQLRGQARQAALHHPLRTSASTPTPRSRTRWWWSTR